MRYHPLSCMLSCSKDPCGRPWFLESNLRHSPPTACRCMVSGSLTPLNGVLFIFRSRYFCTIGHRGVLSLRRWASRIRTRFHETRLTWETSWRVRIVITGLSPSTVDVVRVVLLALTFVTPWSLRVETWKLPRHRARNAHELDTRTV